MDSPFANLDFERFIYRQGQLLASRDFRDQQRMEAARRWMHNSALHNIWGVASGYVISESGGISNDKWDRSEKLIVAPGIAYDCFGRELILSEPEILARKLFEDGSENLQEALVGKTYLLVLRYQECHEQTSVFDCSVSRHSFKVPPPLMSWKQKHEVCYGPEVPILSVSFRKSGQSVEALIERFPTIIARPQARPRMASGQTFPGLTAWGFWEVPSDLILSPPVSVKLGLEVDIDTISAGFQQLPCYFAWLNGPLLAEVGKNQLILEPFVSLTKEQPGRFTFRVLLLQRGRRQLIRIDPDIANGLPWTVCWLGIETSK